MYCLSEAQIDYILNDIRRNGVETEDLQLNLLDHICCLLEQNLKEHDEFEDFYQQTIRRFYKKELREIEEETINLLTFKNYYGMKKLMIGSGAFSGGAFFLGSFLKLMYWNGASIMIVLGFFAFSFIFLPLLFLLKTKEAGNMRDKLIITVSSIVGICYSMSLLFQVMHWPGARILWFSTLMISFFIVLPLYFFNGIRKPETKMNTIVTSIILTGILCMQFTMTAIRQPQPPESTVKVQVEKPVVRN